MKNQEAMRCLLCPKPRCSDACPIHTPVPECMRYYREDKLEEAGRVLFQNNPMTAVTSQVCDWKKFCYGHCVLNARNVPVRWYEIEQEISEAYLLNHHEKKLEQNGKNAAVIGAGPAGMTAAILLAQKGYAIDLYDDNDRPGGVLRYGIPPFRLDRKYSDAYERILKELGVVFHPNVKIGSEMTVSSLAENHDAVLVASGAVKPRALRIPGEDLPHVMHAIGWLKDPKPEDLGEHIIVIGGGNVAMDACRTAKRFGKDTWVYYRKTFANMPANPLEVEEAKNEGVQFAVFEAPVEVRDHSVIFRKCENVTDENGKVVTKILPDTDHEVPCDTLLVAAGETIDLSVFGDTLPELNEWHYLKTDDDGKTSLDKVWTAGDLRLGAKTVVEAAATAKKSAMAIDSALMGKKE